MIIKFIQTFIIYVSFAFIRWTYDTRRTDLSRLFFDISFSNI